MSGFNTSQGTTQQAFAVGGPNGPSIQNDPIAPSPVGAIAVVNNLGVYGNIRAADPTIDADVVTLGYLRGLAKVTEESGLYGGASRGRGLYG